jgi:hypothetical protein
MVNLKISKSAQFQIQQMAFMIIAIFIFFALAAIFVLQISLSDLEGSSADIKTEKAINFLSTIPSMTELSFDDSCPNCLDRDKLVVLSDFGVEYKRFFPLESLKAFKVYPVPEDNIVAGELNCPSRDCIVIFEGSNTSFQEYATFVPVCTKSRRQGILRKECEVWKLVGGIELRE